MNYRSFTFYSGLLGSEAFLDEFSYLGSILLGYRRFLGCDFEGAHASLAGFGFVYDEEALHLEASILVRTDEAEALLHLALDFLLYERLISSIEVVELVDDAVAVGTHIAHYSSFHMASSLTGVDVAGIVDGSLVSDVL